MTASTCPERADKLRHVGNCFKADAAYGDRLAKAMGIAINEVKKQIASNGPLDRPLIL